MINIAKSRAEIEAMQSDLVAVPKAQLFEMFDAVERGQNAERVLTGIRSIAAIGAAVAGISA